MAKTGNELLRTVVIDGTAVNVYGCYDSDMPETEYDFYDLYVDGDCINCGEPCYTNPTEEDIRAFLDLWKVLNS